MGLSLGEDGEDEGGRLIGVESGWHNQVFTRLQTEELRDIACIQVHCTLSHRRISGEESGRKLPSVLLVLW